MALYGVVIQHGGIIAVKKPDGTIVYNMPNEFAADFGYLQESDLGKRIYKTGLVYSMENAEQLSERLASHKCQIITLEETESGKVWRFAAHGARFNEQEALEYVSRISRPYQIIPIPE